MSSHARFVQLPRIRRWLVHLRRFLRTVGPTALWMASPVAAASAVGLTPPRTARAQGAPRAVWSTQPLVRTAGNAASLTITVRIDSGWHLYSLTQIAKGPYPLRITPVGRGVRPRGSVSGPTPERFPTSAFNIPVEWYTGRAAFRVPLTLAPDLREVAVAVRYQTCSDALCLPPTTDTLHASVTSAPASSARATRAAPATAPWLGAWTGTAHYDSVAITFPVSISLARRGGLVVALANGLDSISSTAAVVSGDSATIAFDHLASTLRLTRVSKAELAGWFSAQRRPDSVRVVLHRNTRVAAALNAAPKTAPNTPPRAAPDITGTWWLPVESSKGEHAWRLVVQQQAARTIATLLRVDGDAGAHVGTGRDSTWTLDHFDGTRPGRLELTLLPDGALRVVQRSPRGAPRTYIAWREAVAEAHGVPRPADVTTHTSVRDSTVPFVFDFPDLDGVPVRNTDARFAGKVVLVNVTGSWCPNCHDEAPYLAALAARYQARGFEVVALDFEEPEQAPQFERLRAFIRRYGIRYPYLVAGAPRDVRARIPQAVNLDTWPATFFLGRDGTVRAVRTGFAARASGDFHNALRRDYEAIIERLLAEPTPSR